MLKHCFEDSITLRVLKILKLNPKKTNKNHVSIEKLTIFYKVNIDETDKQVKYRSFYLVNK